MFVQVGFGRTRSRGHVCGKIAARPDMCGRGPAHVVARGKLVLRWPGFQPGGERDSTHD